MVRAVLLVGLVLMTGCEDDARPHAEPDSTSSQAPAAAASQPPGPAVLLLMAAECLDNGEGDECPHGPFGSIQIDFFGEGALHWPAPGAGRKDGCLPDESGRCSRRLPGPRSDPGECLYAKRPNQEWLDGDTQDYGDGLVLIEWPSGQDSLVARVWESDPGGRRLGRRNDILGVERIDRAATESPDGAWIDFRRYTNHHPRRPTSDVAFRLHVKTHALP